MILVCLAAIMILQGCVSAASVKSDTPRVTLKPGPNAEIMESLMTRAQKNVASNTFEGVTGGSAFGDCLKQIDLTKLVSAWISGKTELLGYPAYVECKFNDEERGKIHLRNVYAYIYRRGQESAQQVEKDILKKLDAELGSHQEKFGGFYNEEGLMMGYGESYVWEKGGLKVAMTRDELDPDSVVRISLYYPDDASDDALNGFPYQLGTDVKTVYGNLTSGGSPGEDGDSATLNWADEGILISMGFRTDEAGTIRFNHGQYYIRLNDMELNESIEYFESVADCFESAIGAPYGRGYALVHVHDYDDNGIPKNWGFEIGQRLSAEDMLDSGNQYYSFNMKWPDIHFEANYIGTVNVQLYFLEEFFKSANE